jgi:lysophospholipase L1-like esterase
MSRPRAVVLLALALAVSLGANAYLLQRGESYYAQLNVVRLDPLGLSAHAGDAPPPVTPPRRRVVFFGDSRAQMWISPPDSPELQFVNRGVGNQTSAQVLARFDVEIPPLHPDVLVIEVGVNDLKAIPLFPARHAEIVATVESNVRELVRRSRALGARVILVTVFPIGEVDLAHRLEWSDEVRPSVADVNRYFDTLAGDGVELLHADPVLLGDSGAIRPTYAVDMFHFSASAYAALDEKLLPMLGGPARQTP